MAVYAIKSVLAMAENLSRLSKEAIKRIVASSKVLDRQIKFLLYAVFLELDAAEIGHCEFKTLVRVFNELLKVNGIPGAFERPLASKNGWPLITEVDEIAVAAAKRQVGVETF